MLPPSLLRDKLVNNTSDPLVSSSTVVGLDMSDAAGMMEGRRGLVAAPDLRPPCLDGQTEVSVLPIIRPFQPEPVQPPSGVLTCQQVVDSYLKHSPPSSSIDAAKEKLRVLTLFCEEFGHRAVSELKPYDLLFWIQAHEAWKSNHTRNRVRATVARPFNFCARLGLIERNPMVGVSFPPGETGRDITDAEFRLLLRTCRAPFRRVLFFLRFTGARPIELRRLEWEQLRIELGAALQRIHKTGHATHRPRRLPLVPVIIKLLGWIKRHQPEREKFVFLNQRGRQWTKRAICQHLQRVRERAGLPSDVKLYGNRHAFGTQAILNEVDVLTLAELMGHANVKTTQIYVHLAGKDAHLIKAAEQATRRRV